MEAVDLDRLRTELVEAGLSDELADRDPIGLAQEWIALAREAKLFNPDAMAVASVDAEGRPSVRNVLMRNVIDAGFCFYTNYDSQKGVEFMAKPVVEALFSWLVLERQIRVRGSVERLGVEDSDAYFDGRPRASKLAAIASDQSRPIPDRKWLERRVVMSPDPITGVAFASCQSESSSGRVTRTGSTIGWSSRERTGTGTSVASLPDRMVQSFTGWPE